MFSFLQNYSETRKAKQLTDLVGVSLTLKLLLVRNCRHVAVGVASESRPSLSE